MNWRRMQNKMAQMIYRPAAKKNSDWEETNKAFGEFDKAIEDRVSKLTDRFKPKKKSDDKKDDGDK